MITVEVTGTDGLRRAARDLRAAHLIIYREVMDALLDTPDIIRPRVQISAALTMPSGYAPILAASLRVAATPSTAGWASVRVRARGVSRSKGRDVSALEHRGALRHPVYGNAKVWTTTNVPAGFWSRGVAAAEPAVIDRMERAVDQAAAKIEEG